MHEMQQKQEQQPAWEQEHNPSKVAAEINIPRSNKTLSEFIFWAPRLMLGGSD